MVQKKSEEGMKNMTNVHKKKKRILTFLYHYHIFLIIFAFFVHSSFFFVYSPHFLYFIHIFCTILIFFVPLYSLRSLTWVFSSISTLRISILSKSAIIKIIWSLMEVPFVILMFMMVFRATYLVGLSLSPNIYYKLKRIL